MYKQKITHIDCSVNIHNEVKYNKDIVANTDGRIIISYFVVFHLKLWAPCIYTHHNEPKDQIVSWFDYNLFP